MTLVGAESALGASRFGGYYRGRREGPLSPWSLEKITAALVGVMFVTIVLAIVALLLIVLGISQAVGALEPVFGQ